MRNNISKKVITLVVGMLIVGVSTSSAKPKKPSGGSVSGDLLISKVFYNNMKDNEDRAFIMANYIELYNNCADTLDITGIYLGVADNTSTTSAQFSTAWTASNMAEDHSGCIALKQVFQIPTETTRLLSPGASLVICNSALNHTTTASNAADLSQADYEVKSQHKVYKDMHNDEVPELKLIWTNSETNTFLQFMSPGPFGLVLLAADTKLDTEDFYRGQTEGTKFKIVQAYKTIDAVDFVEHTVKTEPASSQKRMPNSYDAGFIATTSPGGNNGEALIRKTAFIASDGRKILFDTNNSSVDFVVTTDLSIRKYSDELSGMSETTLVIPESGFTEVNFDKPFCGPKGVVFVHVNASNTASTTDLTYGEFPADSMLLIKGPWIAVGKPGSYTLSLSESQGVMRTRSSIINWADEDEKSVSQKDRMFYKFQNTKDNIGFQRVPAVEGFYNKATFSDGARLFIIVTNSIADKIAAANGAVNHNDLEFISWHGIKPEAIADGIETVNVKADGKQQVFDLQGRRVNSNPRHGLYIVGGKKVVF